MPPRRRGLIPLVLGIILLVAGLSAAVYATFPAGTDTIAPIQANDSQYEYFTEFEFSVLAGGSVQGTFSVLNGTPVTVFVFNDADYDSYVNGANLTGLHTTTAAGGTIDLQVPGFNTYHVVFAHAPGFESQEQDVAVNLTSTGIDPLFFLGGLVAVFIGVALLVVGVRRMRGSGAPAPSGVLDSRATYLPPTMPSPRPGPAPSSGEGFRVPPPLPGTTEAAPTPTGDVVVTLENSSASPQTVQLVVNGAPVSSLSLGPGTTQVTTVTARLASAFGSMVRVEALSASGRRTEESVFVGAGGTARLTLRVG
jgi:hypothetical protein